MLQIWEVAPELTGAAVTPSVEENQIEAPRLDLLSQNATLSINYSASILSLTADKVSLLLFVLQNAQPLTLYSVIAEAAKDGLL